MGEGILQRQIPEIAIGSAGTSGLTGQGVYAQALEVAAAHGISLDNHVARAVTVPMLKQYDLILAMEQAHINRISQIAPEVRGKVLLYGKWLGGQEIPDPYGQSRDAFEYVFRLLGEASQEWASRLTIKGLRTCRQKQ
jgi:protein-tyrosine phosphatase